MDLLVVTTPDYFAEEGELINQLFAAGLLRLHIRKPGKDKVQLSGLLKEINPRYYPAVAIHQHHDLAKEFGVRRLHYTAQDYQRQRSGELEQLKANGFVLSSSIHQLEELQGLKYLDYVFFGPVFDSISKTGYPSLLPPDFVLPVHDLPVFAIGGISAALLERLNRMNFEGAAVLGSLWQHRISPLRAFEELQQQLNKGQPCI